MEGTWRGFLVGALEDPKAFRCPIESGLLVIGPPRSGKTTGIVVPNVNGFPGAIVSTSTKPDVLAMTAARRRELGRCWVFDPSGKTVVPEPLASQVIRAAWSPVESSSTWAGALISAKSLVDAAGASSNASGSGSVSSHWTLRAQDLIAPLLFAASLLPAGLLPASLLPTGPAETKGPVNPMELVLTSLLRHDVSWAADLLEARYEQLAKEKPEENPEEGLTQVTLAQSTLESVLRTEERERSGIFSTAAGCLRVYGHPEALALAKPGIPPGAGPKDPNKGLAPLELVPFEPESFVNSCDTLYIVAPGAEQELLAPIVACLVARVRDAAYARALGRPPGSPPFLAMVLDEVANIAPLSALPQLVAEGGGQGVVTLACLQDLSQARRRWGTDAQGFLSLFTSKAILPGVSERSTLELVSLLSGAQRMPNPSETTSSWWRRRRPAPSQHRSTALTPRLPPDVISRGRPGFALVLTAGKDPIWAPLPAPRKG
jgi:type IV secretion system protein VirD4